MKYGEGDVIAVLPTGYGKTVIIHMLPYRLHTINCRLCDRGQSAESVNAILEEQKRR